MEVIDMTELDDDENAAEGEEAEVNGDPGPSTLQSRLYAMATEVTPARIPPEAPYTPTAFKPIKRSMATGRGRISISPAAAAVESVLTANSTGRPTADIVIDEVSSAQQEAGATHAPSEHFDPPGLFTTSLVPTSASAPEQSHFNGGAGATTSAPLALLLPEHVQLDDVIPQDEGHSAVSGAEDVSDPTMEGLHFLESDVAKVNSTDCLPGREAATERCRGSRDTSTQMPTGNQKAKKRRFLLRQIRVKSVRIVRSRDTSLEIVPTLS